MILDLRAAGFRERVQLTRKKGKREVDFTAFPPSFRATVHFKTIKKNTLPRWETEMGLQHCHPQKKGVKALATLPCTLL